MMRENRNEEEKCDRLPALRTLRMGKIATTQVDSTKHATSIPARLPLSIESIWPRLMELRADKSFAGLLASILIFKRRFPHYVGDLSCV
jgi:hypothetical protein